MSRHRDASKFEQVPLCHGRLAPTQESSEGLWPLPIQVKDAAVAARPGYHTCAAHEYNDTDEVLREKIQLLASLIHKSKRCVVYSGAGISTSAGVADYATKSAEGKAASVTKRTSPLNAEPTLMHHVLAELYRQGKLAKWINQNHDGIPQKAGVPQEVVNEIHGAWFDPSNPVVKMSGDLRSDLFEDLLKWEQDADLCLTLGTSLAGMNADRVPLSTAQRANEGRKGQLGTVIVGLQQTVHDSEAALRIFARLDTVASMLADEMGFTLPSAAPTPDVANKDLPNGDVFELPLYDSDGRLLEGDWVVSTGGRKGRKGKKGSGKGNSATTMKLDLSEGAVVKITAGPYEGDEGEVVSRTQQGHYKIRFIHEVRARDPRSGDMKTFQKSQLRAFGNWWVPAALQGRVDRLPIINPPKIPQPCT